MATAVTQHAELLRIGSDGVEVELVPEIGGRLHRLRAFGHELLRTPPDLDAYRKEPFFWGSFVMAPWCNRVAAGAQDVAGARVDLAPNFDDGTAIHGEVHSLPWQRLHTGVLGVAAGGGGWPWSYSTTQELELEGSALRLTITLHNDGAVPMPAGVGVHPWFLLPLEVELGASSVFTSNVDSSEVPVPVSGAYDLRTMRPMPGDLDATWTELNPEHALRLRWPAVEARLRVSSTAGYVCAASPRSIAAVAIEPQTHAPDGLRRLSGGQVGGLQLLAPGEELKLTMELTFARTTA